MVDYSKTKIYRIPVGNENYYGHTAQPLCKRKTLHKLDYNKRPNRKLYKAMREANMKAYDIELIWVEDYPCKSKEQAKARERYYIENFGTLNMVLPWKEGTTEQEYNNEYMREYNTKNREKINAKMREYRSKNNEEINAKRREYRSKNTEEINAKKREYRAKNCEEYNAKQREYRAENREEYNAKRREYRAKNCEEYNAKQREYRAKNR